MINHLIHVGFPKTGSKSLQQWFGRHPQFAFTQWGIAGAPDVRRLEEVFAFDADLRCAVTSYEGFAMPIPDHRRIDVNDPVGLIPPRENVVRLAEAFAGIFSGARILIVTRGFRELCLSFYAQAVVMGCRRTCDDFCRELFVRGDGTLAVDFDFVIGLYERLFGAENVLVLPYELLRDDPGRFVYEIESAGGADHAGILPDWLHRSPPWADLASQAKLRRAIRSVPVGARAQRILLRAGTKLAGTRSLRRALQPLLEPAGGIGRPEEVPADVLERFRGSAERLRHRALYRGLEAEYLL